jgi:CxxC-x17-CxxC domain-containing protein
MPEEKLSRRERAKKREEINKTINFRREEKKGNSRKWPTDVICVACGKKFTLPFKPRRADVYCDTCFKAKKK